MRWTKVTEWLGSAFPDSVEIIMTNPGEFRVERKAQDKEYEVSVKTTGIGEVSLWNVNRLSSALGINPRQFFLENAEEIAAESEVEALIKDLSENRQLIEDKFEEDQSYEPNSEEATILIEGLKNARLILSIENELKLLDSDIEALEAESASVEQSIKENREKYKEAYESNDGPEVLESEKAKEFDELVPGKPPARPVQPEKTTKETTEEEFGI